MNGGTVRDGLIGVDTPGRLLAVEELLDELLDFGNTRGSANEDDLVDFVLGQIGVLKHLLDGLERTTEEILCKKKKTRLNLIPLHESSIFHLQIAARYRIRGSVLTMLSSSNLALVRVSEKSSPSKRDSISNLT